MFVLFSIVITIVTFFTVVTVSQESSDTGNGIEMLIVMIDVNVFSVFEIVASKQKRSTHFLRVHFQGVTWSQDVLQFLHFWNAKRAVFGYPRLL
jgi:hypothetical protein